MGRVDIDWNKPFGVPSSPCSERDICFGDPLPAAKRARAAGRAARARASSPDEQQSQGTHRLHQKLDLRRARERRRPRAQAGVDRVRRPATPAAAKAEAAAWGTDAPPAADENAGSSSAEDEDERQEHASPSAALGGEKNYGQLRMHSSERRRQGGQTNPMTVDKMRSTQLCYAALSGRNRCKFHAGDGEESDHEECQKREKLTFSCCTKRCILCKSLVGAAPPEEIFEALRTIPSLSRTDLQHAHRRRLPVQVSHGAAEGHEEGLATHGPRSEPVKGAVADSVPRAISACLNV